MSAPHPGRHRDEAPRRLRGRRIGGADMGWEGKRGTARRPMGPGQYTNVEAELMQEVSLSLAAPVPLRHQLLVLLP